MGQYQCNRCGEEWDEHPVLQVPCPVCHARKGVWCHADRPSGHKVQLGTELHIEREQAALDAGFLKSCPAGTRQAEPKTQAQLALCLP